MKISLTENDILRHLSFRKLKLNPLKNIILVISNFFNNSTIYICFYNSIEFK